MELLWDALTDAMGDTLKLIPFLFAAYLLMEYIEHRAAKKSRQLLAQAGRLGPLWGAAAGLFPQCGFSAAAANFYTARLISRGTLIAVFLSTSDEMLPILISRAVSPSLILRILAIKFLMGMTAGFLVDAAGRHFHTVTGSGPQIHELCEQEHCDCQAGIWMPALRHTTSIAAFVFAATLLLNITIALTGEDTLAAFLQSLPLLSVALTALAGLIPNCAPSVIMTELYLQGALSFGAAMAGLLVGAGTGLLILFRMNRHPKENLKITAILYGTGMAAGLLLELF
ncbi:MAG: arsenic efflux protein [Lachnospiraceae bacterium]|jgi:hypothetical protein|nr:arsenic efflux protein [Lachnospiraceae bacterium]